MRYYQLTFEGLLDLMNHNITAVTMLELDEDYTIDKKDQTKVIPKDKERFGGYLYIDKFILTEEELKEMTIRELLEDHLGVSFDYDPLYEYDEQYRDEDENYVLIHEYYWNMGDGEISNVSYSVHLTDVEVEDEMTVIKLIGKINCFQEISEKEYKNYLIENNFE